MTPERIAELRALAGAAAPGTSRFGRLVLTSEDGRSRSGHVMWLLECDCGRVVRTSAANVRSGHTLSCGCLRRDAASVAHRRHGRSRTTEHVIWLSIVQRCSNPHSDSYGRYGGRGIGICARWADSFEAFFADMGPRPSPQHSIDRIDNDGDYEPNNCRWATIKEQQRNRRGNRVITYRGESLALAAWSERTGIRRETIAHRLNAGWDVGRALTTATR